MSLLHAIDGGEISLEIDVDQGGRISHLEGRCLPGVGIPWLLGQEELKMA
jgi:hypothetical protein